MGGPFGFYFSQTGGLNLLELDNDTPFPVVLQPWLDKENLDHASVFVKTTYALPEEPGSALTPAEEQMDPVKAAEYFGEPGESSLKYDTDTAPVKPGTDVVLIGSAVSSKPVQQMNVSLSAGPLAKTVRVIGDRTWHRKLGRWHMSDPEPFTEMPLMYERAFGGSDTSSKKAADHDWESRNPVGTGFNVAGEKDLLEGMLLPNLEDPKQLIKSRKDRPTPAGFGFLGPNWMPRVEYGGTYDDAWLDQRAPLLPLDFDDRFFHSAPPDLVNPTPFEGGEKVVVAGVSAQGRLEFEIPKISFVAKVTIKNQTTEYRTALDTVMIEPEEGRVVLNHRLLFACPRQFLYIKKVHVSEATS